MRLFRNSALLLVMGVVLAPVAFAQAMVTIKGSIQSLDSSRANVLIRSRGDDRLIVLPADVPVRVQGNSTRRMSVDDLVVGAIVTIDAMKSPTGQLTAHTVTITPPPDGRLTPAGPSPANKVTIQPSRGAPTGVVVSPDSSSTTSRFVAARTNLLNQPVGELHVNGRTVFRFRGIRGADPYVRAQTVAARLNSVGMANLRPDEVRVRRVGGQWAVTARGMVLITADYATARINGTTPYRLANRWAANMRAQLAA